MDPSAKKPSVRKGRVFGKSAVEFLPTLLAASGILIYDFFGNGFSLLIGSVGVICALTICYEMIASEEKKEVFNFLFKAAFCAFFLFLAYELVTWGQQLIVSKKRDFLDCLGGTLVVTVGCFCFFGSVIIAGLKMNDSAPPSKTGDYE